MAYKSPYGQIARSYGYNYGLLGASIAVGSRHQKVQRTQASQLRKINKKAGKPMRASQLSATMRPQRGDRIGGYRRLSSKQQRALNPQQRALYTARRNTVNTRRANTAIMAGYVAPYAVNMAVKKLSFTNQMTGQRMGKNTYIVGGMKRTGSYWTRQGKRANVAVRVPGFVARGAPSRGGTNGRLMITARSGSRYTRFKQSQRTFTVRNGRVRRDYKGRFAGWY